MLTEVQLTFFKPGLSGSQSYSFSLTKEKLFHKEIK